MASSARHFKAPFLSKETCWAAADQFRQRYCPQSEIPVDVLALVEFELDLEIRTITGLKEDADVDACVLANHGVCDLLLSLAERPRLFVPHWTAKILHEVERRRAGQLAGLHTRKLLCPPA